MEENIPQLKKGQTFRMTETEKARMRETLVRHMEQFPLAHSEAAQITTPATPSPYASVWGGAVFMRIVASALVLVILVGSGATFASAEALPGSFLYPIRIHVKEKAERALLRAPEKKLAYDQARLENRITELEVLAESTTEENDTETILVAKAAFTENLADFESTLEESARSGRLAASVKTRNAILTRLDAYTSVEAPVATMALMKMSAPVENSNLSVTADATMPLGATAEADMKSASTEQTTKVKESIRELLEVTRTRILENEPKSVSTESETNTEVLNEADTTTSSEEETPTNETISEQDTNPIIDTTIDSGATISVPETKIDSRLKKSQLGAAVNLNLSE